LYVGWYAQYPGLVEAWAQEAEWEAKKVANYAQYEKGSNDASDGGWGIPKDNPRRKKWIELDIRVTVSYPAMRGGYRGFN
jgi:hypothetical protein